MFSVSTLTPGGSEYLLQHTLRDLHMLHGDDLAELLQGVNVTNLVHELHTAESINTMQLSQMIQSEHLYLYRCHQGQSL